MLSTNRSSALAISSNLERVSASLSEEIRTDSCQEDKKRDVDCFLHGVNDRVFKLEKELLSRTEDILPFESNRLTVAELTKVCTSLHLANVLHMIHLDQAIFLTEPHADRHHGWYDLVEAERDSTTKHFLKQPGVGEMEFESNRTKTQTSAEPVKTLVPDWTVPQSDTSPTPTHVQSLSSNSDSSPVRNMNPVQSFDSVMGSSLDAIEMWRSQKRSIQQSEPGRVELSVSSSSHLQDETKGNPQALPMGYPISASQSDVVVETVNHTLQSSNTLGSLNTFESHDSISVTSRTVKGAGYWKKLALLQGKSHSDTDRARDDESSITGLTIDAKSAEASESLDQRRHLECSFLTDPTTPTKSTESEDTDIRDQTLLVTPILERYRLEVDEDSTDVKVVPNPRGRYTSSRSEPKFLEDSMDDQSKHDMELTKPRAVLMTISENSSADMSEKILTNLNESLSRPLLKTMESSGNGPPAPHRSPHRNKTPQTHPLGRRPQGTLISPTSHTPITSAWMTRYSGGTHECGDILGAAKILDYVPPNTVSEDFKSASGLLVREISHDVYSSSPRVVRMQVGFDEVNAAVQCLNKFFQSRKYPRIREDEVEKALGMPLRKSQSILMSLCHWRRLSMFSQQGLTYYQTP